MTACPVCGNPVDVGCHPACGTGMPIIRDSEESPPPEPPSRLFLDVDGNGELCLWDSRAADDPAPRCVQRESEVDPIVWSLVIRSLHVSIGQPRAAS